MHQILWGHKIEEKLHLEVGEQKKACVPLVYA
jgi:hypothetical protein